MLVGDHPTKLRVASFERLRCTSQAASLETLSPCTLAKNRQKIIPIVDFSSRPLLGHGWKARPPLSADRGFFEFFDQILPQDGDRALWPHDITPLPDGRGVSVEARYGMPRCLYFFVGLVHPSFCAGGLGLLTEFPDEMTLTPLDSGGWGSGYNVARVATAVPGTAVTALQDEADAVVRKFLRRERSRSLKSAQKLIPREFGSAADYVLGNPPKTHRVPDSFRPGLVAHPIDGLDRRAWSWEVQSPTLDPRKVRHVFLSGHLFSALRKLARDRKLGTTTDVLKLAFPNAQIIDLPVNQEVAPKEILERTSAEILNTIAGTKW